MTTVVYKDGILASDSRCTQNDTVVGNVTKIHKIDNNTIIGFCGRTAQAFKFIEWYKSGRKKEDALSDDDSDFVALVIVDGVVYRYDGYNPQLIKHKFHAIGSGFNIALGAMEAGASAIEAIKIAKKYDIYTGGKVQYIYVF